MKKRCIAALFALAAAVSLAAQTGGGGTAGLLNVEDYSKPFLNPGGKLTGKYYNAISDADYEKIAAIGGEDLEDIDTPLEIALLSVTEGVIGIRPAEAAAMLPAGDPALIDLQLGRAAYMDMQAAKFLGGNSAPHAAALKFITGRGRVTEADIQGFVRQGIAAVADAEAKEKPVPTATLTDIKQHISAFYLTPNQTTFNALKDFYGRINLEYTVSDLISQYKINITDIAVFEKMGWSSSAASARDLVRTCQQKLIPVARARNMTFEQFIAFPWDDVESIFRSSLAELNRDLANRVTQ